MNIQSVSPCFVTGQVEASRDFYVQHFGAQVFFDCGWYVDLHFGSDDVTIQFMAPREAGPPACNPAGLMYNFNVPDVDAEYARLTDAGLVPVLPLEDHPWGDRGFAVLDPNGITLYIFTECEPAEAFKSYFKA